MMQRTLKLCFGLFFLYQSALASDCPTVDNSTEQSARATDFKILLFLQKLQDNDALDQYEKNEAISKCCLEQGHRLTWDQFRIFLSYLDKKGLKEVLMRKKKDSKDTATAFVANAPDNLERRASTASTNKLLNLWQTTKGPIARTRDGLAKVGEVVHDAKTVIAATDQYDPILVQDRLTSSYYNDHQKTLTTIQILEMKDFLSEKNFNTIAYQFALAYIRSLSAGEVSEIKSEVGKEVRERLDQLWKEESKRRLQIKADAMQEKHELERARKEEKDLAVRKADEEKTAARAHIRNEKNRLKAQERKNAKARFRSEMKTIIEAAKDFSFEGQTRKMPIEKADLILAATKKAISKNYACTQTTCLPRITGEQARIDISAFFSLNETGLAYLESEMDKGTTIKLDKLFALQKESSSDEEEEYIFDFDAIDEEEVLGDFVHITGEGRRTIPFDAIQVQKEGLTQLAWARTMYNLESDSFKNPAHFQKKKVCTESYREYKTQTEKKIGMCWDFPIESITYEQVVKRFIPALNGLSKKFNYRLLTRDEYDVMMIGKDIGDLWHASNSKDRTHPVNSKRLGNIFANSVSEMTSDWFNTGKTILTKGSNFKTNGVSLAINGEIAPDAANEYTGFRLVREPK